VSDEQPEIVCPFSRADIADIEQGVVVLVLGRVGVTASGNSSS
jgi:hypothetical protein